MLIGGPSHAGKSTLAKAVAGYLGWALVSTDSMARHPGRPWKMEKRPVPDHVAEHYSTLSVEELVADVMRHYNGMWPDIEQLIQAHTLEETADCLVLEGSAILPERFAKAGLGYVAACWLTADAEILESRIHASSDYAGAASGEQALIQKFVQRNDGLNALMRDAVDFHGLDSVDTNRTTRMDELVESCLELINR
ncbi:MAG: hypothetical protein HOC77_04035 [Chloroflexi bacterium]|nr:hypothetical protein [Chloroflexota bacterium]MBT4072079.1 hypothetical protein [Chloroflexota bacterium]MBT4514248.1 hypothetical protein [Chloroflexota bacterium]MBT6682448.1 hypothetical protein [Chloroflexota bacterium]